MKRKKILALAILSIAVVTALAFLYLRPLSFAKLLDKNGLKIDEIADISISTTRTDPKSDKELAGDEVKEVIDLLNKYSYKKASNRDAKGWQYLMVLHGKDKELVCSIMGNCLSVFNQEYVMVGFVPQDFEAEFLKFFIK